MIQKSFKGAATVGTLFLIPTPIGNLEDITFRAVQTLKTVDLIASEDTRHTQKLLNHLEIHCPQESFHEHNSFEKIPKLLELLKDGKSIAQVSDAGMPSISDPGHDLVLAAIEEEIPVVALPGASAGLTALIASGLAPQPHIFYGFLPRKKQQQADFFETKKDYAETQIFYESPLRAAATLANMKEVYGDRKAVLVRELTKIHEEYRRGKISELLASIEEVPLKGECLILVAGAAEGEISFDSQKNDPLEAVQDLIDADYTPTQAIKQVAKERGLNRQELYSRYHGLY